MSSRRRKHLTASVLQDVQLPTAGQQIVRALAARGGNIVEVERPDGSSTLVLLPARFVKKIWVRMGGYLLVEACPEAEAAPGSKITGTVVAVLYADHIQQLTKVPGVWPPEFAAATKVPPSNIVLLPGSDSGVGLLSLDDVDNPDCVDGTAGSADDDGHVNSLEQAELDNSSGNNSNGSPTQASASVQAGGIGAWQSEAALDDRAAVRASRGVEEQQEQQQQQQQQQQHQHGNVGAQGSVNGDESECSSDEDEGLPPLQRNTNRKIIYHEVSSSEDDD